MIRNTEPLSMPEALEYLKGEENKEIVGFIKKFSKLSLKDGKNLRKELQELNLMKVREEHITKIINILPENAEELNKIFTDVSLDENETGKILDKVKQFK